MLPLSNSSTSILRSPPRFQEDDHCSTDGEGSKPSDRERQSIKEQKLLNAPISCNDWQNESNVENRYPPGSPTLSCLTASIYQMSSPVGTSHTIPASSSFSRLASTRRVRMVDLSDDFTTQRCSTPSPANRYDNRDGCFDQRLGSSIQRHKDGGEVEHQRNQLPYQLPGTESGISGNSGFCQGRIPKTKAFETVDRQHDRGSVHQQKKEVRDLHN